MHKVKWMISLVRKMAGRGVTGVGVGLAERKEEMLSNHSLVAITWSPDLLVLQLLIVYFKTQETSV